jgi:pimeloyl-ACP methyl ester carboxylesterase
MRSRRAGGAFVVAALGLVGACTRTRAVDSTNPPAAATPVAAASARIDTTSADSGDATDARAPVLDGGVTSATSWSPPSASRIDGPHEELALDAGRPVYYAMPRARAEERPFRLVGHLHGMCGPPPYACGKWIGAGTDVGIMVCPTGNARCGDAPNGPPSWEAPTWPELVALMDKDLEAAVAKVEAKRPGSVRADGAILTGYSRGAYAAPAIARKHPNRWRYLVLIEANVPLSVDGLERSGVRAVALVAGEQGTEIGGMQKTQSELERAGFPARLFVMRRTGHLYSEDMEYVMHDALAFVLSHEDAPDAALR